MWLTRGESRRSSGPGARLVSFACRLVRSLEHPRGLVTSQLATLSGGARAAALYPAGGRSMRTVGGVGRRLPPPPRHTYTLQQLVPPRARGCAFPRPRAGAPSPPRDRRRALCLAAPPPARLPLWTLACSEGLKAAYACPGRQRPPHAFLVENWEKRPKVPALNGRDGRTE